MNKGLRQNKNTNKIILYRVILNGLIFKSIILQRYNSQIKYTSRVTRIYIYYI